MDRREAVEKLSYILRVLKGETGERYPSDHEAMIKAAQRMHTLANRVVQELCKHSSQVFSFGDVRNVLTGETVYKGSKDSCLECGKIFKHESVENIGGVDIKVNHLKEKTDENTG